MKELIVNVDKQNRKIIVLLENGIVVERYFENEQNTRIEGNIYLGKVQNVLPGLQAAFVDIGESKNTFIHIKDILPKIDEKEQDISTIVNKDIRSVVKQGDTLLVQVKRDGTNKKGARVSTHINLPGNYCVLLPNTPFITVSQKIEDITEKKRLTEILKQLLPPNYGAIIRTSAVGKGKEVIENDIKHLVRMWEQIIENVEKSTTAEQLPILIQKNYNIVEKILLDLSEQNLERIVVNNKEIYKEIRTNYK